MSAAAADGTERARLLAQAAHCFRQAGLDLDACRCLEGAGSFAAAAGLHEAAGRWARAGQAFEQAQAWPLAAAAFLRAERPLDAARCHLAGGNPLEAAWVLAHLAHRFDRARAALADCAPAGPGQALAQRLAQARCALPRDRAAAVRGLREVLARLGDLDEGRERDRVLSWAYALTEDAMGRPDLTVELLAAAWAAGIDTRGRWEHWAGHRLGGAESLAHLFDPGEREAEAARP